MARQIRFGAWCFDPDTHLLAMGEERRVLEPRVSRLLEFLLAHPGETLSHDQLVDAVWDGRVVSDEAVRRAVSTLRHALAPDGSDHCIRTVHKRGYVALFEASQPQVAMPRAHRGASSLQRYAPPLWQRIAWALSLVFLASALTLTLLAYRRASESPSPPQAMAMAPTLAVLPFLNLSAEADTDFLADGVSEELRDTLARYHGLLVTAHASAFRLQGSQTDVRELGRQLGVRYLLQGSVRKIDERVRIDARLTDAVSGRQIWSGNYERSLAQLLDLQQEISTEVARALELVPVSAQTGNAGARTPNVEAHLEFLRARERLATWAVDDAEQAIAHLQRAIALDPGYAAAYAQLADAIMIRALSTGGVEPVRATVEPLLDKALALDPGLGEAYVTRSWLIEDRVQEERELRKGLELSPNYARGYEMLAARLMELPERQAEALRLIDRALALDPLTPRNHHIKAIFLAKLGDLDGAEELERRALGIDPRFRSAQLWLGTLSTLRGEFAQAVEHGERALAIDPRATFLREGLVNFYLGLGDAAAAHAVDSPATPNGRLALLLFDADWQGAADWIDRAEGSATRPELAKHLVSYARLRHGLATGNPAQFATALAAELGFDGTLPRLTAAPEFRAYTDLAQLLHASGDEAAAKRVQQLLEAELDELEAVAPGQRRALDAVRALLLAQAGRDRDAIAALERAYAAAPLPLWWIHLKHPAFERLRGQPRFQGLVARVDAHLEAQREKLAQMRRRGLVPERAAQNQR